MRKLFIDNLDNCVDIKSKFSICSIRKQSIPINRIVHNIIFLLIIFSFAVSLVSGENKKIDVNVVVSNESLNNSGNISINSSNPLQAEVIGGKEISVKQNEINSSFSNSFNELFFYKSDNSWFVPFILLGIILLLILIYELRGRHVRKISKKKAVKFR